MLDIESLPAERVALHRACGGRAAAHDFRSTNLLGERAGGFE